MKPRRIMVIFGVILLLIHETSGIAASSPKYSDFEKHLLARGQNILNQVMEEGEQRIAVRCIRVKPLKDYAENRYYVIEGEPSGYLIFHLASDSFVEYSVEAPSPYANVEGELYYGGACNYYAKNEKAGSLAHLISGETGISMPQKGDEAYERCVVQHESFTGNNKEIEVARGLLCVPNYWLITRLKTRAEIGYTEGFNPQNGLWNEGMCGWIACGIAILYHQIISGKRLISTNNVTNQKFTNADFTNLLRGYGNNNETVASDLASAVNKYAQKAGYPLSATWGILPGITIPNDITNGKPAIAGGRVLSPNNSKINHYIVVFGYTDDNYLCHFGWPDYNYVYLAKGNCAFRDGLTFSVR